MFCYIIYITYDEFCSQNIPISDGNHHEKLSRRENKTLLINPNCLIGIIIDYILENIGLPEEIKEQLDLVDQRKNFLDINKIPPNTSGLEILTIKMSYHVVIKQDGFQMPLLLYTSPQYIQFYTNAKEIAQKSKKRLCDISKVNISKRDSVRLNSKTKYELPQQLRKLKRGQRKEIQQTFSENYLQSLKHPGPSA